MAETVDLTGEIAEVIAKSREHNRPIAVAYVRLDGTPSISYRGGICVVEPDVIGLWARSADSGMAPAIQERPDVSLIYWTPDPEGTTYLVIHGRARLDPAADDLVWAGICEMEREKDPEQQGCSILVDVDAVEGYNMETGPFDQARA